MESLRLTTGKFTLELETEDNTLKIKITDGQGNVLDEDTFSVEEESDGGQQNQTNGIQPDAQPGIGESFMPFGNFLRRNK